MGRGEAGRASEATSQRELGVDIEGVVAVEEGLVSVPARTSVRVWLGAAPVGECHLVDGATDELAQGGRHRGTCSVDPVFLQQVDVCSERCGRSDRVHWSAPRIDAPMDVVGRYCERIVHAPTLRPDPRSGAPVGARSGGGPS